MAKKSHKHPLEDLRKHDEQQALYWLHMSYQYRLVANFLVDQKPTPPAYRTGHHHLNYRKSDNVFTLNMGLSRTSYMLYAMAFELLFKAIGLCEKEGVDPASFGKDHQLDTMVGNASKRLESECSQEDKAFLQKLSSLFFDARYPAPRNANQMEAMIEPFVPNTVNFIEDHPKLDSLYCRCLEFLNRHHSSRLLREQVVHTFKMHPGIFKHDLLKNLIILAGFLQPKGYLDGVITKEEWVTLYMSTKFDDGTSIDRHHAEVMFDFAKLVMQNSKDKHNK